MRPSAPPRSGQGPDGQGLRDEKSKFFSLKFFPLIPNSTIHPHRSPLPLLSAGRQGGERGMRGLRMFHHNAGDDVGGLVAAVGGIAEMAVDLSHLEHIDRIRPFEEIGQG